jgi:hypothetical protein
VWNLCTILKLAFGWGKKDLFLLFHFLTSQVFCVYPVLPFSSLKRNALSVEFMMNNRISLVLMLFLLSTFFLISVSAQSTGSTVKIVGVKFVAGKRQVIVRGVASDLLTYVYKLNLRKGQAVNVKIDSSESELTFSVFSGKNERLGFRVKDWLDVAYSSGSYSIVIVLSRELDALLRANVYEASLRKMIADEEVRRLKAKVRDLKVIGRGGTDGEKDINTYNDQVAVRKFNHEIEVFKLEREIAEIEAKQKERMEKIPYSLR